MRISYTDKRYDTIVRYGCDDKHLLIVLPSLSYRRTLNCGTKCAASIDHAVDDKAEPADPVIAHVRIEQQSSSVPTGQFHRFGLAKGAYTDASQRDGGGSGRDRCGDWMRWCVDAAGSQ